MTSHAMQPIDDPYLRMQAAAGAGWNAEFLRFAHARFPASRGADVADVLAILDDEDWDVGAIEAWQAAYAVDVARYEPADVRIALLYARVVAMDPRAVVYRLARKRRGPVQ
jgi:hypothetical protein